MVGAVWGTQPGGSESLLMETGKELGGLQLTLMGATEISSSLTMVMEEALEFLLQPLHPGLTI